MTAAAYLPMGRRRPRKPDDCGLSTPFSFLPASRSVSGERARRANPARGRRCACRCPSVAVSGLAVPLPAIVERVAASLVPFGDAPALAGRTRFSRPLRNGAIVARAGRAAVLARATRRTRLPPPPPLPSTQGPRLRAPRSRVVSATPSAPRHALPHEEPQVDVEPPATPEGPAAPSDEAQPRRPRRPRIRASVTVPEPPAPAPAPAPRACSRRLLRLRRPAPEPKPKDDADTGPVKDPTSSRRRCRTCRRSKFRSRKSIPSRRESRSPAEEKPDDERPDVRGGGCGTHWRTSWTPSTAKAPRRRRADRGVAMGPRRATRAGTARRASSSASPSRPASASRSRPARSSSSSATSTRCRPSGRRRPRRGSSPARCSAGRSARPTSSAPSATAAGRRSTGCSRGTSSARASWSRSSTRATAR